MIVRSRVEEEEARMMMMIMMMLLWKAKVNVEVQQLP